MWLSWVLESLGQLEEAERVAREGVAIAQQVSNRGLVEWANGTLCDVLRYGGRFAETKPLLEGYLAYGRERGDRLAEAWAWWDLAANATHLGSYEEARGAARSALTISEASGNRELIAFSHMELGRLALPEGAYDTAHESLQQSIAIYRQIGGLYSIMGEAIAALAYAARGLGQLAQAREHLRAVLHSAVAARNFFAALHSLPPGALLLMDAGKMEKAVELYALASRYPFVANSRWFEDVAGREIAAAAATLPPDVVAAAQERGRARDLWVTMEELLAELEG
jgi:tetratricopeptide (TPR) repeat protein